MNWGAYTLVGLYKNNITIFTTNLKSLKQLDDDKKEKIYSQITNFFTSLEKE